MVFRYVFLSYPLHLCPQLPPLCSLLDRHVGEHPHTTHSTWLATNTIVFQLLMSDDLLWIIFELVKRSSFPVCVERSLVPPLAFSGKSWTA